MDKPASAASASAQAAQGFVQKVFSYDNEVKCQVLNIGQYGLMALIPAALTLHIMERWVPEPDEKKGPFETGAEVALQLVVMLLLVWFGDRVIQALPTLSGCPYGPMSPASFILPFVLVISTMQSKLGAKLGHLLDRLFGLQAGPPAAEAGAQGGGAGVRVTQPLAPPGHHPSQADMLDTNLLVPSNRSLTTMPNLNVPAHVPQQKSPDFNQMYQGQGQPTPMPGAAVPGMPAVQEPMAANALLGGGFGGSAW